MRLEYLIEPSFKGFIAIAGQRSGKSYISYRFIRFIHRDESGLRISTASLRKGLFTIENDEHYKYLLGLAKDGGWDVVEIEELVEEGMMKIVSSYARDLIENFEESPEIRTDPLLPYKSYDEFKRERQEIRFMALGGMVRELLEKKTTKNLTGAVKIIFSGIVSADVPYDATKRMAKVYLGIDVSGLEEEVEQLRSDLENENYESATERRDRLYSELSRRIHV